MSDPFLISTVLREDAAGGLYRGVRQRDGASVLVKTVRADPPAPREVARLGREYEILAGLEGTSTPRPLSLEEQAGRLCLVLEGFEGGLLSAQVGRPWEIGRFLDLAVRLTETVGELHRQGVIHKDLRPANVLFDPGTGALTLVGFGLSARLSDIPPVPAGARLIEGSPAYMAPEQTGQMNRGVDHRSDLYALGVIFCELLTGELPFQAGDPLEWVHCHVARWPRLPAAILASIPMPLNEIVAKLLAKEADERYQSARGLAADLEHCRQEWASKGSLDPFPLGTRDLSHRLVISPRLYGREGQIAELTQCLERVRATGRTEFVLVSGYSGIGKTSLVRELLRPVVEARGHFLSGKYDQYRQDIPYATLAGALEELLQRILTQSGERVRAWRADLLEALAGNGRLIVDLIPRLELVLGPQPPVPVLLPSAAENRLHAVFQRFIGVFARREHPLVLFLDDLQWLDPASLRLLTRLLSEQEQALLLIGAYRDNEVDPAHPLMIALEEIRRSSVALRELSLGPLALPDLTELVADTLRRPAQAVRPLARLVQDKTAGNPFFVIQFLVMLFREGLLVPDEEVAGWVWDLVAIRRKGFTDNVVELMLAKVKALPSAARHTLMLAACLGSTVTIRSLTWAAGLTPDRLDGTLREAMDEGLLSRGEDTITFLHDRVQEAAYALLAVTDRAALHLDIGRALVAHTAPERLSENVFEVVGQLNRGASLITSDAERTRLAELNLIAGRRAKAATAFASAASYLAVGRELLGAEAWDCGYELAFALHTELAECDYLAGDFGRAEELLALAADHARSVLDRAHAHHLRQRLLQLSGHFQEALDTALAALELFGVRLPDGDEETWAAAEAEMRLIGENLRGRRIADLADVPFVDDAETQVLIALFSEAIPLIQAVRGSVHPLIAAKGVNACLERGHVEASAFVYGCFALAVLKAYRDVSTAEQFSAMALELNERSPAAAVWRGKLLINHATVIHVWRHPLRTSLPMLDRAFHAFLDSGDLVYAGYATYNIVWLTWECGAPLEEVADLARRHLAFAHQRHYDVVENTLLVEEQFVRALQGRTRSLRDFSAADVDDADRITALERAGFRVGAAYHHVLKQIAAFHAGHVDEALEWAERAAPLLLYVSTLAIEMTHHVFQALSLAALYDRSTGRRQQELGARLRGSLEKLQTWADHCPDNIADRYALVRAEAARIEGRDTDAMRLFERAIRSAAENGYVHHEALAAELSARFYRSRGIDWIATAYLRRARDCYARWGAHGKVRRLDQEHPGLAGAPSLTPEAILSGRGEQLDLLAVVKASQAISGEIMLPHLQEILVRIALEHAGAQRGCLVLVEGERLSVHARAETEGDRTTVEVVPGTPASAESLPITLLHYVVHSGETVVLADAATDTRFSGDAYVARRRPRSVLGLPITRQGTVMGLLYMENNVISGAFIPGTLAVLELLAAQAAISLETARLYSQRTRAEVEARLLSRQLAFRAMHDDLTGLPNRALLLDHLHAALARAQRSGTAVGVLFIDLDDFKSVNDSFGHVAADGFLVQVGQRISASLREADTAARVGGDEFVVVCEELTEPAAATLVAQRIRIALSADIPICGRRIGAPASIGIAVSGPTSTAEELLREADAAMYKAKGHGGRWLEPADAWAHTAVGHMLEMEAQLREAIRTHQFLVHYQPTINLQTARIVGVEALLRWQHPTRGLLAPQELIHVAERRNLIGTIGAWVLETACRQAAAWVHRYGAGAPTVAVNVSSRQLGGQGLTEQVHHLVQNVGLPPDNLCLEITETQFVSVDASATADLLTLHRSGVGIAVDDFGTGFAGFDYLRRLPVSTIKIDKSYVRGLGTDRADTAIVASVITLADNLGLRTVAEGIETGDQRDRLRHLKCTDGQGWLWYPAMPAEEVETLIRG